MKTILLVPLLLSFLVDASAASLLLDRASSLADTYVKAIEKLNEEHKRKPTGTEEELAARLPKKAAGALESLLKLESADSLEESLRRCSEAALELDRVDDFNEVRERWTKLVPERAAELDVALSRPRYLLIGRKGLTAEYLEHFAEVLDEVFAAYDEVFGFAEWSKVPGKKVRFRVHLEDKITTPPHFAPQFPFHSEVNFPVIDPERLTSPTSDGKFLFYGLCHELGHVMAMWGDGSNEEDHHAWAHYTGVVIVEHLSEQRTFKKLGKDLRDVRWRSLKAERKRLEETPLSLDSRDGVLRTLIALHDEVGAEAIGAAMNHLYEKEKCVRVNAVRYQSFRNLRTGLLDTLKARKAKKAVSKILP